MRAILRKWPKRQGRMLLQALYGDPPHEARRIVPANVSVSWNEATAPEPVFAEAEGDESLAAVAADPAPASYA